MAVSTNAGLSSVVPRAARWNQFCGHAVTPIKLAISGSNANVLTVETGGEIRDVLADLRRAIATSLPPLLAEILGVKSGKCVKNYTAS